MGHEGGLIISALIVIAVVLSRIKFDHSGKGYETYLIRKGRHYSIKINRVFHTVFKISLYFQETLRFTVMFGEGSWYGINDYGKNGYDHNKLYGLIHGWKVHKNSARIAWLPNVMLGRFDLYAYVYNDGVRLDKYLTTVNAFEEVKVVISQYQKERVSITIDGRLETFAMKGNKLKFKLFPYFGGDLKAPNDMKIYIKETKK